MLIQKLFAISSLGHEVTLWLLIILSIISTTLAMERYFFLRAWTKSTAIAKKSIMRAIELGQPSWIQSLHQSFVNNQKDPGTLLVSSYIKKKPHLIVDVFDSFILSKKNDLESRLTWLASVGSNAPFIGLLGTIFGVMDAFSALGLSSQGAAPIVMLGIAKALLATAVGLIVAIPAIVTYNFLRRKVVVIIQNLEYIKGGYLLLTKDNKDPNVKTL